MTSTSRQRSNRKLFASLHVRRKLLCPDVDIAVYGISVVLVFFGTQINRASGFNKKIHINNYIDRL